MKFTILGSGTATPVLKRNAACYLLETGKDKILFDSGPGTIKQLLKNEIALTDINHIFYTHLHNDHINDLPAILWSNNYGTKRKHALHLYGPRTLRKYYGILTKKIMGISGFNYPITIQEMRHNSVTEIPLKSQKQLLVITKKSKHTDASVSYRIEYNNKVIVYSGDTDYSKNIILLAKNADLLVLECSFPDKIKVPGHLTPSLCGEIASKAGAKKLILTHIYPEADRANIKKECRKTFSGDVVVAQDFMALLA